jgi:hypothetical protein
MELIRERKDSMRRLYPQDEAPEGVSVPQCFPNPPSFETPPEIKTFFGKTGRWWGTWKSPQTKGNYDIVLVIQEIYRHEDRWEAKAIYASADYPKWYVEGGTWESVGTFNKKPDGKMVLSVRHPAVGVMEFWFEANRLQGKLSMRFMLKRIILKPLYESASDL